jgi:sugar/nucleoside kinase (ribokinase family)
MNKTNHTTNKKPLIIGAGLVVLDIILNNGDTVPIFKAGGTCGNVLAGLSYMGWESAAVARSGSDSAGKLMIKDLSGCGVNVTHITREEAIKTPRIVERLKSNGTSPKHTFLLRCPVCSSYLPRFQSPTLAAIAPPSFDREKPAVFFFDRVSPAILKLAQKYKDLGALIFFEPNNLKNVKGVKKAAALCHVVKYSGGETKAVSPTKDDRLLKKMNPPLILKTLGKEGVMFSLSKSDAWHYQKGVTVDTLWDTCGAGDWCTIGFLYYLNELASARNISLTAALRSYPLINHALQYAQTISAISCGFVGARGLSDSVTCSAIFKNVEKYMSKNVDIGAIISLLTEKKLEHKVEKRKRDTTVCPVCLLE